MNLPTYTLELTHHWRKWPGRTACGLGLEPTRVSPPHDPAVSCVKCLTLLASHFPGLVYRLTANANLPELQGEATTYPSYDAAEEDAKWLRRKHRRWKGVATQPIVIRVVPETQGVTSTRAWWLDALAPRELPLVQEVQGDTGVQGDTATLVQGDTTTLVQGDTGGYGVSTPP